MVTHLALTGLAIFPPPAAYLRVEFLIQAFERAQVLLEPDRCDRFVVQNRLLNQQAAERHVGLRVMPIAAEVSGTIQHSEDLSPWLRHADGECHFVAQVG